ncbi:MAG: DUF4126 family protein [Acidobacteriota bacterium]
MGLRGLPALAIGIGAIAGLRTLIAPAIVSRYVHRKDLKLHSSRLKFLKSGKAANAFAAFALGELVNDKLPFTPNRTQPPSLAARIASGALCGAALYSARRHGPVRGALLGGLGAAAGSFGGLELRRRIGRRLHVPDRAVAVAEDALAVTGGVAIVRQATA